MERIPAKDRALEVNLEDDGLPSVKTLGVLWVAKDDVFQFRVNPPESLEFTKREFLSRIARLFDPMGFLAPFTIQGKMLLQEMWLVGVDWNEPLPEELVAKAKAWFKELPDLSKIEVPRCLQLSKKQEVVCRWLCQPSLRRHCQKDHGTQGRLQYLRVPAPTSTPPASHSSSTCCLKGMSSLNT